MAPAIHPELPANEIDKIARDGGAGTVNIAAVSVDGLVDMPVDDVLHLVDLLCVAHDLPQPDFRFVADDLGNLCRERIDPTTSFGRLQIAMARLQYLSDNAPEFDLVPDEFGNVHREYVDADYTLFWNKLWGAITHLQYLYNNPGECVVPSPFGDHFGGRRLKDIDDGPWMGFHAYSNVPSASMLRDVYPVFTAALRAVLEGCSIDDVLAPRKQVKNEDYDMKSVPLADEDWGDEHSDMEISDNDSAQPDSIQDTTNAENTHGDSPMYLYTGVVVEGIGAIITKDLLFLPEHAPSPSLHPPSARPHPPTPDPTSHDEPASGTAPTSSGSRFTLDKPPLLLPSRSASEGCQDVEITDDAQRPAVQDTVRASNEEHDERMDLYTGIGIGRGNGAIIDKEPLFLRSPGPSPSPRLPLAGRLPTPDLTPNIPVPEPTPGFIASGFTPHSPPLLPSLSASVEDTTLSSSRIIDELSMREHSIPEVSGFNTDTPLLPASAEPTPPDDSLNIEEPLRRRIRRSRIVLSSDSSEAESIDTEVSAPPKRRSDPRPSTGARARSQTGDLAGFVVGDDEIEYESDTASTDDDDPDDEDHPPPSRSRIRAPAAEPASSLLRTASKKRPRPSSSSSDVTRRCAKKPRSNTRDHSSVTAVRPRTSRKRAPALASTAPPSSSAIPSVSVITTLNSEAVQTLGAKYRVLSS